MVTSQQINNAFLRLPKRAESSDRATLVETFVDVGALFTLISSADHQVLYGRRGTGKTHAMLYLAERRTEEDDIVVYIDMRTIGSSGGLYADSSISLAERATRLAIDTLDAFYSTVLERVVDSADLNLAVLGPILDALAQSVSNVAVVGTVQRETQSTQRETTNDAAKFGIGTTGSGIKVDASLETSRSVGREQQSKLLESGAVRHRVDFGSLGRALTDLVAAVEGKRIWVLIDEWSVIPIELQPFLADLIRRSMLPVKGITVKIGAIEQRTNFQLPSARGDYVGLELGADVAADLNLDDFMVFDNDAQRATEFFRELLYRHYRSAAQELNQTELVSNSHNFVREAFTQANTFEELVRSAEGVPRDAINILSVAAQKASQDPIATAHVRTSAKIWYSRDKEAAVSANPVLKGFLHWIIDDVISGRRARAFLIASASRHRLIDALFDARVLHLLKRNVSAPDQPGIRYDVYKIDYGCYVDLISTARAPQGLLPLDDADGAAYVEVPPDDYRAIRRAILEPEKFEKRFEAAEDGVDVQADS
jgi:hypothetical protein